ncbi:DUF4440 domain-containing protein [bacterium]|nr:MAG: DUF4440 domain-containing protein [bacterium]
MASPLLLAVLALLAPVRPETPTAIARRTMATFRKAFLARNAEEIAANVTEDFTFVDVKGEKTRREFAIAEMRRGLARYKRVNRYDENLVTAKRVKEGVLMVTEAFLDVTVDAGGKLGHLVTTTRTESLLVPRGKGWAYRRIRLLSQSTTLPGGSMLDPQA